MVNVIVTSDEQHVFFLTVQGRRMPKGGFTVFEMGAHRGNAREGVLNVQEFTTEVRMAECKDP